MTLLLRGCCEIGFYCAALAVLKLLCSIDWPLTHRDSLASIPSPPPSAGMKGMFHCHLAWLPFWCGFWGSSSNRHASTPSTSASKPFPKSQNTMSSYTIVQFSLNTNTYQNKDSEFALFPLTDLCVLGISAQLLLH